MLKVELWNWQKWSLSGCRTLNLLCCLLPSFWGLSQGRACQQTGQSQAGWCQHTAYWGSWCSGSGNPWPWTGTRSRRLTPQTQWRYACPWTYCPGRLDSSGIWRRGFGPMEVSDPGGYLLVDQKKTPPPPSANCCDSTPSAWWGGQAL